MPKTKMPSSEPVLTPLFRISFPNLGPGQQDEKGRYTCKMLFPDDADLTPMKKEFQRVAKEAFGNEAKEHCGAGAPGNPFKGPKDSKHNPEGYVAINASSKQLVGLRNVKNDYIEPDELYAGCWCRAFVVAYAYDNKRTGVGFGIRGIQKVKDGERLDGFSDPEFPTDDVEGAEVVNETGDEDWD